MKEDFLRIEHEDEQEFEGIANKLMNNSAIQTHDSMYRITEIEFYWNSPTHQDLSTYDRKYVKPKLGDWFFHYSGVDIALENTETGGYGGILIRSIYSLTEQKSYKGPLVCSMKLFSGTSAFTESIKTKIVECQFRPEVVQKKLRIGLGENAKPNGMDKLNYGFNIILK